VIVYRTLASQCTDFPGRKSSSICLRISTWIESPIIYDAGNSSHVGLRIYLFRTPGVKDVFGIGIEEAENAEGFFSPLVPRLLARFVCVLCGRSRIRRPAMTALMMAILGLREDLL
jgi:hypothetical protein